MNITPEYDPARGIIRLPRPHLEAMVAGDRAVLDPRTDLGRLLAELGVVVDGGLDPALRRVLALLRRPRRRFGLRVETVASVARHRGWIGETGVVVVSGGQDPDDVQDVRHAPRPTATARIIARLIELGPTRAVDRLPAEALSWPQVAAPVRGGPGTGWAGDAFGSTVRVALHHLRWSADGVRPATTAMVLLSGDAAGLVEAVGVDGGFRLVSRTPTEVWTGLCALARSAVVELPRAPPGRTP
ncbi:MAG: hypothetical protein ACRD0A_11335 [Acidimicrobiales bacterium]